MTVYRVGDAGATVFDEHGQPVSALPPGHVIVPGSVEVAGSLAAQHADNEAVRTKRLTGYADKQLRPTADKATPARRPDPRLSHVVLEGGRQKQYPSETDG